MGPWRVTRENRIRVHGVLGGRWLSPRESKGLSIGAFGSFTPCSLGLLGSEGFRADPCSDGVPHGGHPRAGQIARLLQEAVWRMVPSQEERRPLPLPRPLQQSASCLDSLSSSRELPRSLYWNPWRRKPSLARSTPRHWPRSGDLSPQPCPRHDRLVQTVCNCAFPGPSGRLWAETLGTQVSPKPRQQAQGGMGTKIHGLESHLVASFSLHNSVYFSVVGGVVPGAKSSP